MKFRSIILVYKIMGRILEGYIIGFGILGLEVFDI